MKKRLQTRVMFRFPNSPHLHASALLERQTVPISIQLYLQNNSGRYQKAKQKEEVISSRPAPLARCCSPPPLPLTLPRQRHDS
jgi:hypothetical protein